MNFEFYLCVKQFEVTVNKERLNSIETKAPKHEILITISAPKELDFYAASEYKKSLSWILPLESIEPLSSKVESQKLLNFICTYDRSRFLGEIFSVDGIFWGIFVR